MTNQSLADTYTDIRVENASLTPFISNCYRSALQQLRRSFLESRPDAILVSEGRIGPSHVIDDFLTLVGKNVTVAKVPASCSDSASCMRSVVRSIGFEPNEMSLDDLESVLEMFLQYQRTHNLRTIICLEDSHLHGLWVLDKMRRLIELEAKEKFGLMVIISGPPSMISVLNEPILDVITEQAGDRIVFPPFTLSETRAFVRHCVETAASNDGSLKIVDQVFEFVSVSLMHELCAGIPDNVNKLYNKCLDLINGTDEHIVSVSVVRDAAKLVGLTDPDSDGETEPLALEVTGEFSQPAHLKIKTEGEPDREILLDQQCILIGRDRSCAICISDPRVSRYHALISISSRGLQLVDLDSTNGTLVNMQRTTRCILADDDVVSIGRTKIVYAAGGEQLSFGADVEHVDSFEVVQISPPSITLVGEKAQMLRKS